MYKLGNQVCVSGQEEGVYAVGAVNGEKGCLVIANTNEQQISLDIKTKGKIVKVYNAIQQGDNQIQNNILPAYSVVVVEIEL